MSYFAVPPTREENAAEWAPYSEWRDIDRVRDMMRMLSASEGKLGESATYQLHTGGKFFRARLALQACRNLSLKDDWGVAIATACEFLHNASLIHDDIQDGDRTRRYRPSVWSMFGVDTAILLGDLFLTLGVTAGLQVQAPPEIQKPWLNLLSARTLETIRGQAMELDLRQSSAVAYEDYEAVACKKTGALLALAIEGPLVLSGAGVSLIETAHQTLKLFGLAYQLFDDICDFMPQPQAAAVDASTLISRTNIVVLCFDANPNEHESWESARAGGAQPDLIRRIITSGAVDIAAKHFEHACAQCLEVATELPGSLREIIRGHVHCLAGCGKTRFS